MHNNYYFLRQVSQSLQKILIDTVISECFSQQKDELIIRFETHDKPFHIKASVLPSLSCLSFPSDFQRARKNSVDLFGSVVGRRVKGIRQFQNERSFALELSDGFSILFKMHGNRANIIVFEEEHVAELFRNNLEADTSLTLTALDRVIDWSKETFLEHHTNLPALYFTFGKILWEYLGERGFNNQLPAQRWEAVQELLSVLSHPAYHIVEHHHAIRLSLVPIGTILKTLDDPIAASNEFYYTHAQHSALFQEKNAVLSVLRSRIAAGRNYNKKNLEKLTELEHDNNYKEWADLIMANLHRIGPNTAQITVSNFYNNDLPAEIRLKPTLSPQKNAEVYYRKSKNQQIEIDRLLKAVAQKEEEILTLELQLEEAGQSTDLKALKKLQAGLATENVAGKQKATLPYHEFIMNGYRIWVGKNAQANDTLTLKLGFKDDLWLHAKDVAGSHVLIKHQAGKNFPKDVIERAAQLAAYNSKRKNETLCPVIVTPKKYVRKRKGDPAGAVVVEREDVIMVEPKL